MQTFMLNFQTYFSDEGDTKNFANCFLMVSERHQNRRDCINGYKAIKVSELTKKANRFTSIQYAINIPTLFVRHISIRFQAE